MSGPRMMYVGVPGVWHFLREQQCWFSTDYVAFPERSDLRIGAL